MTTVKPTRSNIILLLICLFYSSCNTSQKEPAPYGALPSERQLHWQETEMYCIMHYGLVTYANKEWGYGDKDPATFAAPHFDAGDVIRTIKQAGFNGIVLVAKHHDGFCLWPTTTTGYNITQSPWKNGKGDMVKEYQEACEKENFKLGIYCSPWDRNHPLYGQPEYVTEVYIPQLKELYSNYGQLFMSWHDGANGGGGYYGGANEHREIDRETYYGWEAIWKITRTMQPDACLFGDAGPDVRWVGNEDGFAAETSWATYTPEAREPDKKPANGAVLYEKGMEGTRNGKYWMPAECDVPLRPGWFYHKTEDQQVKTPAQLLELYYKSVGRGACLDLGINLDTEGRFPEGDKETLLAFGRLLKSIFDNNLIAGATFTASNIRGNNHPLFGPANLIDGDRYSYWATDDKITTPELIIDLPGPRTFNVIRLRENIKLGQRIEKFAIDTWKDDGWKEITTGTSIGANRLIPLTTKITSGKLRLRILQSPVCITLSDVGLFVEPDKLSTVDEIVPTDFEQHKEGWKIVLYTSPENIERAIDGDESTFWQASSHALPQELIIDMGSLQIINGITYLPRQDRKWEGIITWYRFYISPAGETWQEVAAGEFSNIAANPLKQRLVLDQPVPARYVKMEAIEAIPGEDVTVAEIGIF